MAVSKVVSDLAVNLREFMADRGLTQQKLAALSGVKQTTISLYLRPEARNNDAATGKRSSPTLAGVEAIASALQVEIWELLLLLTPKQRGVVKSVLAVVAEHTANQELQTPRLGGLPPPVKPLAPRKPRAVRAARKSTGSTRKRASASPLTPTENKRRAYP